MVGKLRRQDEKKLETWMGAGAKTFSLLYSFTRDGSTAAAFHQKCDSQGPTVTVLYNTNGSVYGGYVQQAWDSSGTYKSDVNAFLFRLQLDGNDAFEKFPIKQEKAGNASWCHVSYGPMFGAGHDLNTFNGNLGVSGTTYTLNGSTGFGNSYDMKGITTTQITNDIKTVTDFEVYKITDSQLTEQWRITPDWTLDFLESLKGEIEHFTPPKALKVKQSRILILGPVGAGKSSFFNTIASVFRGHVTSQACSGSAEQSITSKYRMYVVRSRSTGLPLNFRLCDTRGLEESQGIDAMELSYLLDGHVPDGYQFNPSTPISSEIAGFKAAPTLNDKIHCVCFVIDGSTANILPEKMLEKLKSLQIKIHQKGIPQVVLLTKIDTVCSHVNADLSVVFRSPDIGELVHNVSQILGIPRNRILPMKNYEKEIDLTDDINLLSLLSLRQMLRASEDFMFNYLDQLDEKSNMSDNDI